MPLEQRANVQGTADVLMGFGGAAAGLSAGVVVGLGSYALLNLLAACLIIGLLFMVIAPARSPLVQQQAGD